METLANEIVCSICIQISGLEWPTAAAAYLSEVAGDLETREEAKRCPKVVPIWAISTWLEQNWAQLNRLKLRLLQTQNRIQPNRIEQSRIGLSWVVYVIYYTLLRFGQYFAHVAIQLSQNSRSNKSDPNSIWIFLLPSLSLLFADSLSLPELNDPNKQEVRNKSRSTRSWGLKQER